MAGRAPRHLSVISAYPRISFWILAAERTKKKVWLLPTFSRRIQLSLVSVLLKVCSVESARDMLLGYLIVGRDPDRLTPKTPSGARNVRGHSIDLIGVLINIASKEI
jgi:hypothetical protein